jgi:hypothetical protein
VVTPDHILIEPEGHKLILVGFCAATPFGMIPQLVPLRWRNWIDPSDRVGTSGGANRDLRWGARSMEYLLGKSVEPGIARHLQRAGEQADAWRLLEDFDKLIEALWGPRVFRPFKMVRK